MKSTKTLKDIIEAAGYKTRSYSGRGMYGKECLAVSLRDVSESEFYADLVEKTNGSDALRVAKALRNMRTDSLGRGIVLYFPSIEA